MKFVECPECDGKGYNIEKEYTYKKTEGCLCIPKSTGRMIKIKCSFCKGKKKVELVDNLGEGK